MKTQIIIEFNEEMPQSMLNVLISQLNSVCGQDKEGYGWGGGKHTLKTRIVENETNKSKRNTSSKAKEKR